VKVVHLSLANFRNYETAELDLQPGPTLFVGSNGQGKTNLVEALGYLSTLGSHRVSTDHALIRSGEDAAIVRARLEHGERAILAEVQINRVGANRAQINRSAIRTRELPRYFSSVLFAPEDLALVRGEPTGRRRFLDELLVLRSPRLAGVLADYDRVLRQRSTLLKSARASGVRGAGLATLDIWDEQIVELGSEIILERENLVRELVPEVRAAYASIAGDTHAANLLTHLSIQSASVGEPDNESIDSGHEALASPSSEEAIMTAFRSALERVRRAEIERGVSLVGPHRDDLILMLNALPARGYASHGESWSFALALKLAAAAVLRVQSHSGDPVLILDDVFAELDRARRARLAEAVADFEQVLITAAVLEDVPVSLAARVVTIRAGSIVESGGSLGSPGSPESAETLEGAE
jgi:DNA replication and repair protein RecF